jgi:general stress protein 26
VTTLEHVKATAQRLSPWAHLATVGADQCPDVVPVHPCWEGDVLWVMVGMDSVKARNVAANAHVALHWQVTEVGDGLEIWGTASCHDDVALKQRLWTGVFDYDLSAFAPGGPQDSAGTGFMCVRPQRALVVQAYGAAGTWRWRREA